VSVAIGAGRGDYNRLGYAIQLCNSLLLRHIPSGANEPTAVPRVVIAYFGQAARYCLTMLFDRIGKESKPTTRMPLRLDLCERQSRL
jgi:hypothetical protein